MGCVGCATTMRPNQPVQPNDFNKSWIYEESFMIVELHDTVYPDVPKCSIDEHSANSG